jgi:predicted RNase H-like nuclease (RuvC/YqgF family)
MRLTGFANHNQTRMEDLEAKMQSFEKKMESMNLENATLKRIINFAIPPESIKKALIETAKRLPNMTEDKVRQLENILAHARSIEELQSGLVNITTAIKREPTNDQ